ncbi:MAG: VOC family protein [Terriglobales bacterium]
MRFVGVELYFDDLERAREFFAKTLGLKITSEQRGHQAQFGGERAFVCLGRKGAESYPSQDKAVLFFEVPDSNTAIEAIGENRIVERETRWAVLHDPEGHNILLLQSGAE